jgi:hypothetical protein
MAYEISEIKSKVLFSISIVTYCKLSVTLLLIVPFLSVTQVSLILMQILKN